MYVCMYVFIYVRTWACMYVCITTHLNIFISASKININSEPIAGDRSLSDKSIIEK